MRGVTTRAVDVAADGAHERARGLRWGLRRWRSLATVALSVSVSVSLGLGLLSACSALSGQGASPGAPPSGSGMELDIGYYWQSIAGHVRMLTGARPVEDWIADPATPAALRARLQLSQDLRAFAVQALHLPDNASYRRYADTGRPAAVWNVVAAPAWSLTLKTWCFPVLGCVGYRGYFDKAEAEALGATLRQQGWEVSVYGVPAYSTLGKLPGDWLADPLLNTFIQWSDGELARLVFHELAHQVAFAANDTMFNESFATAVERIGVRLWLAEHGGAEALRQQAAVDARREDFRALTLRYRAEFQALYAQGEGAMPSQVASATRLPAAELSVRKAALLQRLRDEYAHLKAEQWAGYAGYDRWFAEANNASLGVLAAYNGQVAAFEALFEQQGRDFPRFYADVRRLAALPKAERDEALAHAAR